MPTLLVIQVGLLEDRTARDPDPSDSEQPATSTVILDTIVAGTMHENQDTSSSGHADLRSPDERPNSRILPSISIDSVPLAY